MKPAPRFLWLAGLALLLALGIVVAQLVGVLPFENGWFAVLPLGVLVGAGVVDFLASVRPSHVTVQAHTPPVGLFTGETRALPLILRSSTRLPAQVWGMIPALAAVDITPRFSFQPASSPDQLEASPDLTGRKRGVHTLGPVHLVWHSPWHLWEYSPRRPLDVTLTVTSDIRPVTSGQIDLHLRSRQQGEKTFRERGEGSDFLQLNDFVAGMDPRSMDWKRSARAHRMLAREMQSERNHQVILALDHGALMGQQVGSMARVEHAINAMLALGWAVVQSRDDLGLFTFAERPTKQLSARSGTAAHGHMRQMLADVEWQKQESNLTLALTRLSALTAKRSLIVLFSDFADPLTAQLLLDHLALLSRRHVVIFVAFQDPLLPATMGQAIASFDDMAEAVAAGRLAAERRAVLGAMAQMGVHVIEAPVGQITTRLLNTYLAILAREEV